MNLTPVQAFKRPATMVVNAVIALFMIGTALAMESPDRVGTLETFVRYVVELAAANPQFATLLVGAWLFATLFVDTKESSDVSHAGR